MHSSSHEAGESKTSTSLFFNTTPQTQFSGFTSLFRVYLRNQGFPHCSGFTSGFRFHLGHQVSPRRSNLAVQYNQNRPHRVPAGCDSGFGNATAKRLDSLGFEVFATVLEMCGDGARDLQRTCSHRLTLLQVDITQPQQVQQALLDTKAKLGLRGL